MIKQSIVDRINEIKSKEEDFRSSWWKNNFVSYTKTVNELPFGSHMAISVNKEFTEHVSEVDYDDLDSEDLVRIFEYIILTRQDIIRNRVQKEYFT